MGLSCRQTEQTHITVFDGGELVAEIRELRLVLARFKPGVPPAIGNEVPLPLYWMQYANHEHPERSAASRGMILPRDCSPERVTLECHGSTESGSCKGLVTLTIERVAEPIRYRYVIDASLEVVDDRGWTVTPNPHHGEIEFANLWPVDTFVKDLRARKRYHCCCHVAANNVWRIPHHHGETADKHGIRMRAGERFLWLLEDYNLCLTYLTGEEISAGLCAYMWDAHFAYKVCNAGTAVTMPRGKAFSAAFSLECIDRAEAAAIESQAIDRALPASEMIPMYVDGVNRFTEILGTTAQRQSSGWPWEHEVGEGMVATLVQTTGFDDSASLSLSASNHSTGHWKATAFGPDYGGAPFPDRVRFRLSAYVKCNDLVGKATIALRIHPQGKGSLFDLRQYDLYESSGSISATAGWTLMEVVTPPISPAPDRLHILLTQDGRGTTWFDNVSLEVL